jgi:hypothetical protein
MPPLVAPALRSAFLNHADAHPGYRFSGQVHTIAPLALHWARGG